MLMQRGGMDPQALCDEVERKHATSASDGGDKGEGRGGMSTKPRRKARKGSGLVQSEDQERRKSSKEHSKNDNNGGVQEPEEEEENDAKPEKGRERSYRAYDIPPSCSSLSSSANIAVTATSSTCLPFASSGADNDNNNPAYEEFRDDIDDIPEGLSIDDDLPLAEEVMEMVCILHTRLTKIC